ncbi:MAG: hypothetical protein K6F98_09035 [Bacteroidales bacterium]|nr:hypothetical protein [Bacteroidales bacterium]
MKKLFYCFVMVALVFSCNLDNTAQLAGSDSGTKAQNPSDAWQQTIDQADEAIKNMLINIYTERLEEGRVHTLFRLPIDVNAPEKLDVFGIPAYIIDSALWVTSPALPLDAYLRPTQKAAVFYIFDQDKIVARMDVDYDGEKWGDGYTLFGGADEEQTQNVLRARNAGEKILAINPAPKRGNGPHLIYAFFDNEWRRIDSGLKRSDDPVEDLRLGWNRRILNLPPLKERPTGVVDIL